MKFHQKKKNASNEQSHSFVHLNLLVAEATSLFWQYWQGGGVGAQTIFIHTSGFSEGPAGRGAAQISHLNLKQMLEFTVRKCSYSHFHRRCLQPGATVKRLFIQVNGGQNLKRKNLKYVRTDADLERGGDRKRGVSLSCANSSPDHHWGGQNQQNSILVVVNEQLGGVRGSVSTLGSIYAVTLKQNINRTMFGFVKNKHAYQKRSPREFNAPPSHKKSLY